MINIINNEIILSLTTVGWIVLSPLYTVMAAVRIVSYSSAVKAELQPINKNPKNDLKNFIAV